jgi:hypothetical protein
MINWKRFATIEVFRQVRISENGKISIIRPDGGEDGNNLRLMFNKSAPASVATAGNATITAAQVLQGIYVRDCAGAGRTDTFDTAALLVSAVPNVRVGDVAKLHIVNGSDAAETLTLAAGTGGAFDTNQTAASRVIPQNASKDVYIRFTNVKVGSEAVVIYA